jgi:hypothetical protein
LEPAIIAKPGCDDPDPSLVAVAEIGRGEAHTPPSGDTSMDLDLIRPRRLTDEIGWPRGPGIKAVGLGIARRGAGRSRGGGGTLLMA